MEFSIEAIDHRIQLASKIASVLIAYVIYRIWIEEGSTFTSHFGDVGKVIIVTGATSGIGKATAMAVAKRGGRVILASTDKDRSIIIRNAIVEKTGNTDVHYIHLDLASLASVRSFVDEFLQQNDRLDVLINNASTIGPPQRLTVDGLETHMSVNHYGPFLLTKLLLDVLKKSVPSRIVNVSSAVHNHVIFRSENVDGASNQNTFQAYAQSKLANIMFTRELSARLRNSGVVANTVISGAIYEELAWRLEGFGFLRNKKLNRIMSKLFYRSATSRAQCSLFAAFDVNFQNISGQYLKNMWLGRFKADAEFEDHAKWLWAHSEKVTSQAFE